MPGLSNPGTIGLVRAVTSCTQPGAPLSGDVLRVLKHYLHDDQGGVDAVYSALMHRAFAEPISTDVVIKVVHVLKLLILNRKVFQCLVYMHAVICRHPPSSSLLMTLQDFCAQVQMGLPLPVQEVKVLNYVATCAARLLRPDDTAHIAKSPLAGNRSSSQVPTLHRLSHGKTRLQMPTMATVHSAMVSPRDPSEAGNASASISLASPQPGDRFKSASAQLAASPRQVLPEVAASHGPALLLPRDRVALPAWAVQPPVLLEDLLAPLRAAACGVAMPGRNALQLDMRWIAHVSGLNPSLTNDPYVSHRIGSSPDATAAGQQASSAGSGGNASPTLAGSAPPISVAALLSCVLDLSPAEQQEHLVQVAARVKLEASSAGSRWPSAVLPATAAAADVKDDRTRRSAQGRVSAPERESKRSAYSGPAGPMSAPGVGGVGGGGGARNRVLFHPPPYTSVEPLQMSENDIGVIVEVVCGAAAAHALLQHEVPLPSQGPCQPQNNDILASPTAFPSRSIANSPSGMLRQSQQQQYQQQMQQQQQQLPSNEAALSCWEDEYDNGDFGHVCSSLLIKLIMDMWIAAGPEMSYLLVLRMLRKALTSSKQQTRARVFDLLYNLSIHASILEPSQSQPELHPGNNHNQHDAAVPTPSRAKQDAHTAPVSPSISFPPTQAAAADTVHHDQLLGNTHGTIREEPASIMDSSREATPAPIDTSASTSHAQHGRSMSPDVHGSQKPNDGVSGEDRQHTDTASSDQQGDAHQQQGTSGPESEPGPAPGTKYGLFCCWTRALLFRLLEDLHEAGDDSEAVWQAAASTLIHMCCHGGHWVAHRVDILPMAAIAGLLGACRRYRWSVELHCHLIRLASHLLLQSTLNPDCTSAATATLSNNMEVDNPQQGHRATLSTGQGPPSIADSAADMEAMGPTAHHAAHHSAGGAGRGLEGFATSQEKDIPSRTSLIPAAFGGLQGLLDMLVQSPCLAASLDLLPVLCHYLTPDDDTAKELAKVLGSRGAHLFVMALHEGLRAPRTRFALQLSAALCGVGIGTQTESAANSMETDAAATMRVLGAVPAPPPSVVANMGTITTDASAVLPPWHAVLVHNMLKLVEVQALSYRRIFTQSSILAQYQKATIMHITPLSGTAAAVGSMSERDGNSPALSPSLLAKAWGELKATCGGGDSPYTGFFAGDAGDGTGTKSHFPSPGSRFGNAPGSSTHSSLSMPGGGLFQGHATDQETQQPYGSWGTYRTLRGGAGISRASDSVADKMNDMPYWRRSDDFFGPFAGSPTVVACSCRKIAVHWLSKVLVQALHACQGNPALLTPINLRTSEAGRFNAPQLVGTSGAGHRPPHAPDAAPLTAGKSSQSGIANSADSPFKTCSWTGCLAEVLQHCVREVPGGCRLLVAAASRAVVEIRQGLQEGVQRQHMVMSAYNIALQWVMQSGNIKPGSDSYVAALELADFVLTAITQPCDATMGLPAIQPAPGNAGSLTQIPRSLEGSAFLKMGMAELQSRSGRATPVMGQSNAAGGGAAKADGLMQGSAKHLHVATALIQGYMHFAQEPLQATPVELLVTLVRSIAQPENVAATTLRGFHGRPYRGSEIHANGHVAGAHDHGGACTAHEHGGLLDGAVNALPAGTWCDSSCDRRLALLMAIMARCTLDPDSFAKYGLSHLIKEVLLPSDDVRERYYSGVYLLRHWQVNQQDKYWKQLRQLVLQAQQLDDDSLLNNPYLTVLTMTTTSDREGQIV